MNSDFLPELQLQLEELMPLIRDRLSTGNHVRFMPRGKSMLPMLREGVDSVVLSAVPGMLKKYDLPLYQRLDGKYILHRIVGVGEEYYACIGDNQFRVELGVSRQQMIAVVSGFYRKDRYYTTDNFVYQLYCRFWHYTRIIRYVWRKVKSRFLRLVGVKK